MPRHFFVFMFRNELEMLQCQLEEHYDDIDRFILVEATVNHQGRPKPLVYAENRDRFAQWNDKIIHVPVDNLPPPGANVDPWFRERMQRDASLPVIRELAVPGDVIVNCDVDEVPSGEALAARPDPVLGLNMKQYLFAVDWWVEWNVMGTLVSADLILSQQVSLSAIREQRTQHPYVNNGGWHFSWVGGQQEIQEKLFAFCHLEHMQQGLEANAVNAMYGQGRGSLGADPYTPVEVDETWPKFIRERRCPESWFRPR
jgi:hypothetical protein